MISAAWLFHVFHSERVLYVWWKTEIESTHGGIEDDFQQSRVQQGAGFCLLVRMPLEWSFVAWTPIRPLFVLTRWGLAECDCALTPKAIRSGGNYTFILYCASALIPSSSNFPIHNRPWSPPGKTAHLHTHAKELPVNQLQSKKSPNLHV